MKKILILGGIGFIGLALTKKLLQKNCLIYNIDNLQRGELDDEAKQTLNNHNINFINADLSKENIFKNLLNKKIKFDEIYFFASYVGVKYTKTMPDQVLIKNSKIILNVIDYWSKTNAKLLFSSTSEIYSGGLEVIEDFIIPTPETVPLIFNDIKNPRFTYSISKLFGETAIHTLSSTHQKKAVIVRFHNIYGPRMGYEHVIPELCLRLIRNENPYNLYGCEQTRAFCFIDDAIDMVVAAMKKSNYNVQTYNIGNDSEEISIKNLLNIIIKEAQIEPKIINFLKAPSGSPDRRCPNIEKIKKECKIIPKIKLSEGIKKIFEWYKLNYPNGIPPR